MGSLRVAKKTEAKASDTIIAYKGFDKDWKCRDFQFELGQTYTHDGPVALCQSGFHACEQPMDVFGYYPLGESKYAQVELGGVTDQKEGDTKRVGKSLVLKVSLDIAGLVKAQIEWVRKHADGKSIAEGRKSRAASSGDCSSAASSGYSSSAASSGYSSSAASSGDCSSAASSGDSSSAASSGYSSSAASSGYSSSAASSGDSSRAASSGDYSRAASSGDSSRAASSGDYSRAASSGDYSRAASSGDYSRAASSGDRSSAACDTNGFACIAGIAGRVKGNAGSALSLGYRDKDGRNRIAVGYVGENGIEADVWYRLNERGEFVKE
jgi:hypothetical protein